MQPDWFDNDELFFGELHEGHEAAVFVAETLREMGLQAVVTPLEVRERVEDRFDFADEHDLLVGTKRPCRVDVKSRRLSFRGPADYPYRTAFVDTVSSWRQKTHKPVAIVLVSRSAHGLAVVRASTEPQWHSRRRYDRRRHIEDDFLEVDKRKLAAFEQLVEWLRARER